MWRVALAVVMIIGCVDGGEPEELGVDAGTTILHPSSPPYCQFSQGAHFDNDMRRIPVWLMPGAGTDVFQHADGTPASSTELGRVFRFLLNEFQDHIDLDVDLYYTTSPPADGRGIAIRPTSSPTQAWKAHPFDTNETHGIDICNVFLGTNFEGTIDEEVVLHELTHCLGLAHPEDCGISEPALVTNSLALEANAFREYEIEGLEWAYGQRQSRGHGWSINASGTTWTPVTSSLPIWLSRGPVTACNAGSRNGDLATFTSDAWNSAMRWDTSDTTASFVPSAQTWTSGAIACGSSNQYMVAYVDQIPSSETPRHRAYIYAGGVGSTVDLLTNNAEASDQLRATYDPATQRYLIVYHRGRYSFEPTNPGEILVVGGDRRSIGPVAGTPAIACGAPSVVGAENCIVAWVEAGWDPKLRWVHGHVDPTTLRFEPSGASRSQAVYPWGGPAIAYTGNPTTPWMLVFHTGSYYLWSYSKGASTTASWSYAGLAGVQETSARLTTPTILSYSVLTCGSFCFNAYYQRVYTKSYLP